MECMNVLVFLNLTQIGEIYKCAGVPYLTQIDEMYECASVSKSDTNK
jgi:hypothetical protein